MTADAGRQPPVPRDIARRVLGRKLKEARVTADLTQKQASRELGWSMSKFIRHEEGDQGTRPGDVRKMLALYGIEEDGARARKLEALAKDGQARPWWETHADIVKPRLGMWLSFEEAALTLRSAGSPYAPDLLQTQEYAAALLTGSQAVPLGGVGPHCALLAARQERMASSPGARAEFIVHEASLLREIGGRGILARQLGHLAAIAAGERPGVSLRVVPTNACSAAAVWQVFTVAETQYGDMLLTGDALMAAAGVWGQGMHDTPAPGPDFRRVFGQAEAAALTPGQSADLLEARRASIAARACRPRQDAGSRLAAAGRERAPGPR